MCVYNICFIKWAQQKLNCEWKKTESCTSLVMYLAWYLLYDSYLLIYLFVSVSVRYLTGLYSCDKSYYMRSVYSQCYVELLKCTEQNNQNLTQVSQLYVHISYWLEIIRSWLHMSTAGYGHVVCMDVLGLWCFGLVKICLAHVQFTTNKNKCLCGISPCLADTGCSSLNMVSPSHILAITPVRICSVLIVFQIWPWRRFPDLTLKLLPQWLLAINSSVIGKILFIHFIYTHGKSLWKVVEPMNIDYRTQVI